MDSMRMVDDRPMTKDEPRALPDFETGKSGGGEGEIRCPLCGWVPRAQDLWMCRCRHSWHTFDTGGVCPNCLHQWESTQCRSCHRWSPHSDWYPKDSS